MPTVTIHFKRVLRNFAANVVGQTMSGVYQIILVPLFLYYWNKQTYGEWLTLFSIPSLLWFMEGGLSGVAGNRMTVASSSGDWEQANTIFQNVLLAQGILCVALFSGALAVVSTFDLHQALGFLHLSAADTSVILVLLVGYMIAGFYMSLFRSAYRASAVEARGIMSSNLWRLADFLVALAVLVGHGRPVLLAEALLACATASVGVLYLDVRRVCPRIEFGLVRSSWTQSKRTLVDGLPLLAGQAAGAFFQQGYPLMINRVLGAPAVVTFVTLRTVSRTVLLLIQVVSSSSAPEVSRSYGRQDWFTYLRLLKIMLAFALWGGVLSLVGLTVAGPWLINLWTSGKVVIGHAPMCLFAISIALQGIWGVGALVLLCSNMHHGFNYLYFSVTMGILALAWFTLPIFGFIAVPGTMALQDAILVVIVMILCKSKLTHIAPSDLRPIITVGFYREKLRAVLQRIHG